MVRFVVELVIFTAVLLAVTYPVSRALMQRQRAKTVRKWRIAAVACAAALAAFGWSSRLFVSQCSGAGNGQCNDVGSAGIKFLVLGGFVAWALISAYMVHNEI